MKVGIIGNYGNENNGDEAILKGIIQQLTEKLSVDRKDIVVFSNNPVKTSEKHGVQAVPLIYKKKWLSILLTIINSYRAMKGLDLLIIGGGGLLMDLYKMGAPLYSTLARIGKRAGCKVVVYGVGAGPINTRVGAFFIRSLLRAASVVSVRDPQSQKLLETLYPNKIIHLTADPALALNSMKEKSVRQTIQKIGVTAVPYYDKNYWPTENRTLNRQYIEGMAKNLDHLLEGRDIEITLYSTKYPQDVKAAEEIQNFMKNKAKTKIVRDLLTPDDLINISLDQDLVIGTRLHSLILAIVAETPVIGIAYHKKVRDFMEAQGIGNYVIPIEELHQKDDQITALYEQISSQLPAIQGLYKDMSEGLRKEAANGITRLLEDI